ncbi:MAG: hypothetical protein KY442_02565, partial [Proteobacteria bacterium]|nr:hypothetical protein [Pseudomonadota bacterium]
MKAHHRWPRTSPPVTFTEKILARKLAPPDPRYQIVSDKVAVRPWVAQRIGEAHLVPALAVYGYDELDRLELAPGQVLKCANRSGGVYFSDEEPDRKALITKLRQHLDFNFGDWTGETWYADVPRRVLVEQALRDEHGRVP